MKVLRLVILVFLFSGFLHAVNGCETLLPDSKESTRAGAHMEIVIFNREVHPLFLLNGKIFFSNGLPADEVMVEIFDHPEWMDEDHKSPPKEQKRLAVCITGKDGAFLFPGIPKGEYELRVSKSGGFNRIHQFIRVDPETKGEESEGLEVFLEPGS